MALHWKRVLAAFTIWAAVATSQAAAGQIDVAFVTCVSPFDAACTSLSDDTQVSWRVVNVLGQFDIPFPGSNDLRDATLDFAYQGGSSTTHWDTIPATAPSGSLGFVETAPFDALLVKQIDFLKFTATLPRTDFDPLFSDNPYLKFVADGPNVTVTQTEFPPPMDVNVEGQFVTVTPEPGTLALMLAGLSASGLLAVRRRRAAA